MELAQYIKLTMKKSELKQLIKEEIFNFFKKNTPESAISVKNIIDKIKNPPFPGAVEIIQNRLTDNEYRKEAKVSGIGYVIVDKNKNQILVNNEKIEGNAAELWNALYYYDK